MISLAVAAIVLACLLGGALLGMGLRGCLPEHHLSQDSTDVIKLATGLMATLAALVLGLLISSANATHNTVKSEYKQAFAGVVLLDQYLAAYGQDTEEARALVRHMLVRAFQARWPQEDFGQKDPAPTTEENGLVGLAQQILRLMPRNESQKWFQSQALQLLNGIAQSQLLLMNQEAGNNLPTPILVVLVAWSTAIFISFGLFVRPNPTVIAALSISALAVAGAIFLILELNNPFSGLIQVSSAPAHAVLAMLGQ
jgi:hypothetical protein